MDQVVINRNLTNEIGKITISNEELSDKARYHNMYLILKEEFKELVKKCDTTNSNRQCLEQQLNMLKAEMEKKEKTHKQVKFTTIIESPLLSDQY